MSPIAPFLAPDRDDPYRSGRPKTAGASFYSQPGVVNRAMSTGVLGPDLDVYSPMYTRTTITVDQLAAEVTTGQGATTFRIGVYRADANLQPVGAPLADSGTLSGTSTGVITYTPGTPFRIPRGRFLTVFNTNGTTLAHRVSEGNLAIVGGVHATALGSSPARQFLFVARAYAAFPTPGTAWDTASGNSTGTYYPIWLRISTP